MYHVELACGGDVAELSVRRFSVREGISRCFEVGVWAASPNDDIDLDGLIGVATRLRLNYPGADTTHARSWAGICFHAEQTGAEATGMSQYHLKMAPPLWFLTQRKNYRIFQHKSAIDIVTALLEEWRIDHVWRVGEEHAKYECRVQYGELDFAFLSRILEEDGIGFFFDHEDGSKLVLHDAPHHEPLRGRPIPYVENATETPNREFATAVSVTSRLVPGRRTLRDVDFRRRIEFPLIASAAGPVARENNLEQFEYVPGGFVVETIGSGETPAADDRGAARAEEKQGRLRATRAVEAQRAGHKVATFRTTDIALAPGMVTAISGHGQRDIGDARPLLVTEYNLLDGTFEGPWLSSITAVPATEPFRPSQRTLRPHVSGVQSAVVVGPPASHIHTDEFGRVRVQFLWDRENRYDDSSSCWVRVSQGWAGGGFGHMMLPRVGQEVLVGFIDGNPDQPVVVGRVFNNLARTPLKLPENATQSVWRTQSVPGGEGYNEILFEDASGKELVNIQAQRNLSKLVKADEFEVTGSNQTIKVGIDRAARVGKVDSILVGEKHVVTVENSETGMEMTNQNISHSTGGATASMSGGNFAVKAAGNIGMSAAADIGLTAGADVAVTAGANMMLKAGGDMSLEAGGDVSIKAGGSVTIKAGGPITIQGADVTIQGGTVKIN